MEKLYRILMPPTYRTEITGEKASAKNMEVVNTLFIDYWKPRYLLNHNTRCAYEFMNDQAHLAGVGDSDIDWKSLRNIPDEYRSPVKTRNAMFPFFIRRFENSSAEVCWQLNPDGKYWMDDDGFGMPPDVEFNIYGFIGTTCKVIVPYQVVIDNNQFNRMRMTAKSFVRNR